MFNTKPLARVNVARMVHSKFPKFGSRDVRNSLRPYSLPEKNAERVAVYFKAADKVVDALPGENIVEVYRGKHKHKDQLFVIHKKYV